ncbi:MAG: GC-type dockerin domain-anchored protein [Planctomycetota bacterium]
MSRRLRGLYGRGTRARLWAALATWLLAPGATAEPVVSFVPDRSLEARGAEVAFSRDARTSDPMGTPVDVGEPRFAAPRPVLSRAAVRYMEMPNYLNWKLFGSGSDAAGRPAFMATALAEQGRFPTLLVYDRVPSDARPEPAYAIPIRELRGSEFGSTQTLRTGDGSFVLRRYDPTAPNGGREIIWDLAVIPRAGGVTFGMHTLFVEVLAEEGADRWVRRGLGIMVNQEGGRPDAWRLAYDDVTAGDPVHNAEVLFDAAQTLSLARQWSHEAASYLWEQRDLEHPTEAWLSFSLYPIENTAVVEYPVPPGAIGQRDIASYVMRLVRPSAADPWTVDGVRKFEFENGAQVHSCVLTEYEPSPGVRSVQLLAMIGASGSGDADNDGNPNPSGASQRIVRVTLEPRGGENDPRDGWLKAPLSAIGDSLDASGWVMDEDWHGRRESVDLALGQTSRGWQGVGALQGPAAGSVLLGSDVHGEAFLSVDADKPLGVPPSIASIGAGGLPTSRHETVGINSMARTFYGFRVCGVGSPLAGGYWAVAQVEGSQRYRLYADNSGARVYYSPSGEPGDWTRVSAPPRGNFHSFILDEVTQEFHVPNLDAVRLATTTVLVDGTEREFVPIGIDTVRLKVPMPAGLAVHVWERSGFPNLSFTSACAVPGAFLISAGDGLVVLEEPRVLAEGARSVVVGPGTKNLVDISPAPPSQAQYRYPVPVDASGQPVPFVNPTLGGPNPVQITFSRRFRGDRTWRDTYSYDEGMFPGTPPIHPDDFTGHNTLGRPLVFRDTCATTTNTVFTAQNIRQTMLVQPGFQPADQVYRSRYHLHLGVLEASPVTGPRFHPGVKAPPLRWSLGSAGSGVGLSNDIASTGAWHTLTQTTRVRDSLSALVFEYRTANSGPLPGFDHAVAVGEIIEGRNTVFGYPVRSGDDKRGVDERLRLELHEPLDDDSTVVVQARLNGEWDFNSGTDAFFPLLASVNQRGEGFWLEHRPDTGVFRLMLADQDGTRPIAEQDAFYTGLYEGDVLRASITRDGPIVTAVIDTGNHQPVAITGRAEATTGLWTDRVLLGTRPNDGLVFPWAFEAVSAYDRSLDVQQLMSLADAGTLFGEPVEPCGPDIASLTGVGTDGRPLYVPDGRVSTADLTAFVEAWLVGDRRIADVTGKAPGARDASPTSPNGIVDLDDLRHYINDWLAGCP